MLILHGGRINDLPSLIIIIVHDCCKLLHCADITSPTNYRQPDRSKNIGWDCSIFNNQYCALQQSGLVCEYTFFLNTPYQGKFGLARSAVNP